MKGVKRGQDGGVPAVFVIVQAFLQFHVLGMPVPHSLGGAAGGVHAAGGFIQIPHAAGAVEEQQVVLSGKSPRARMQASGVGASPGMAMYSTRSRARAARTLSGASKQRTEA